jgi:hypothetical protein
LLSYSYLETDEEDGIVPPPGIGDVDNDDDDELVDEDEE